MQATEDSICILLSPPANICYAQSPDMPVLPDTIPDATE
jgi:hypothetical protein